MLGIDEIAGAGCCAHIRRIAPAQATELAVDQAAIVDVGLPAPAEIKGPTKRPSAAMAPTVVQDSRPQKVCKTVCRAQVSGGSANLGCDYSESCAELAVSAGRYFAG